MAGKRSGNKFGARDNKGKMRRRQFLLLSCAAGASLVSGRACAAGPDRPNFVFLFSDDQRSDTIGALGNPVIQTPHLDGLVRQGVSFVNAYIMGSNQGAVCVPSRAMMMTGRYLHHLKDPNNVRGEEPMWPEILRRNGYTTFGIGKWHNGPGSFNRSFENGAKIFFGGMSDHRKMLVQDYDPSGRYGKERAYVDSRFSSELFADEAINFVNGYRRDEPFALYVAFTAPHDPRMAPEPFASMYAPEKMPMPPNFQPRHPFDNGELEVRDEKLAPWPRTPEIVQRHLADYYGMISHLDAQIGRVLAALSSSSYAKNTVIIFCGDNGLAVGQHGLLGKQSLYEHSIHVPLILSGPGIAADQRNAALCYLLDLFPTLCETAGAPVPDDTDGRSLLPIIKGGNGSRDSLYFQYRNFQRAVRVGDLKLIRYSVSGSNRTQLFNLKEDPYETADLSRAHPDEVERLMGVMREKWGSDIQLK